MTVTAILSAGTRTAQAADGLRAAAAFLEDHPDLPVGWGDPLSAFIDTGDFDADRAEIDRIAAILGTSAEHENGNPSVYVAVRPFGGGVAYRVSAVSRQFQAECRERASYSANIQTKVAA